MKKLIGSAAAALVGAALLFGGPATLASWSDTETGATTVISSGSLDLGDIRDVAWTVSQVTSTSTSPAVAWNGTAIVPGDVLTATVNVPVSLDGKNLVAELSAGTPHLTAGAGANGAALAAALTARVSSIAGTSIAAGATPAVTLTAAQLGTGTKTVPVVLTISFPWGTAGQYNGAVSGNVTFDMDYSLTQLDRAP